MGNIVIATPVLSDAATSITSSGETSAGPVENLRRMQPTDVWQSTTLSPYIEVDLGVITQINLVALLFVNATAAATMRVRTANTQAGLTSPSPGYDSGAFAFKTSDDVNGDDGHGLAWIPASVMNQWVRIDISDASNPDGSIMAGRLYVASALQTTYNYDYGAADGFDDNSTIDDTDGGQLIPNDGTNRVVFEFTLNTADETERHAVREINRKRGASKDVLILQNPDATTNAHDLIKYGLLQRRRTAVNTAFNCHQVNYQLKGL